MNTATLRRGPRYSKGIARRVSYASVGVRYQSLRDTARASFRAIFPGNLKQVEGATVRKLSLWRQTGGGFADVSVLMYANPEKASAIAEFFDSIARTLNETRTLCLHTALRAEQVADCAEDMAEFDVMLNANDANAIRCYIERCDEYAAALRDARAAAVQRLEELEGAR